MYSYQHRTHEEFIFLTSLNLGGAEKIVSDQLWANHYLKYPTRYTLIVLYEKEKEHPLPPDVKIVRLHGKIEAGSLLFSHIAYTKKTLVCHLINDKIANYLFEQGIYIHLVVHNDKRAWSTSVELLSHPHIISIVAVCDYVKKELELYTDKPVISLRHQIRFDNYLFRSDIRAKYRDTKRLGSTPPHTREHTPSYQHHIKEEKIVTSYGDNHDKSYNEPIDQGSRQKPHLIIGMIGRICEQKNYPLALDALYYLSLHYPQYPYKLVIAGGFEKTFTHIYLAILKRINVYALHDKVELLGFRKDASALMNTFDIALNTSYFEGLSMATQELMGNGLPVILSRVCGQPEIYDLQKQLHFFDIPADCDSLVTLDYSYHDCPAQYRELIATVAEMIHHVATNTRQIKKHVGQAFSLPEACLYPYLKIEDTHDVNAINIHHTVDSLEKIEPALTNKEISFRYRITQEQLLRIGFLCYGSHRLWALFNHIKPRQNRDPLEPRTLFLSSNMNLGGAQKSLVNLLTYLKNQGLHEPSLMLLNKSHYTGFLQILSNNQIKTSLCHDSIDVFDLMKNLLDYIDANQITQIVFWNVESKIKLLLTKLVSFEIDMIDVSPGDYIFNEIKGEEDFQDAIYYRADEYYSMLKQYISKYHFDENQYTALLKRPAKIITNGVYIHSEYTKSFIKMDKSSTKEHQPPYEDTALSHHQSSLYDNHRVYDKSQDFKFLVCGRIAPSKHLHIIFEAFKQLQHACLYIIGSAEECYSDYYKELLHQSHGLKIHWLGNHDNPQSVMRYFDAIIVLGTHQGSPNTVLEAASVKLPVIANDSGGTREIIDMTTGVLLPAIPDRDILYQSMKNTMEDYPQAIVKAETCYQHIKNHFSMEKMAQDYVECLGLERNSTPP